MAILSESLGLPPWYKVLLCFCFWRLVPPYLEMVSLKVKASPDNLRHANSPYLPILSFLAVSKLQTATWWVSKYTTRKKKVLQRNSTRFCLPSEARKKCMEISVKLLEKRHTIRLSCLTEMRVWKKLTGIMHYPTLCLSFNTGLN